MANAAGRLFNIMQKSGTDTVSQLIGLTVKSINPLELSDGDKLILTEEFLVFKNNIDKNKIKVGDKFLATTLNGDQIYYIDNIIDSEQELDKYIQEIILLQNRVSSLENRMTSAEERISTLESEVSSLDRRVTALENR